MTNLIASIESKASGAAAPIRKFADHLIDSGADLLELQFNSARVYSDIGFRQLEKLTGVTSLDQARDFAWGQLEPLSEVNKQLLNDWKGLVAINNGLKDGVKEVFAKDEKAPPVRKASSRRKTSVKKAATTKPSAVKSPAAPKAVTAKD